MQSVALFLALTAANVSAQPLASVELLARQSAMGVALNQAIEQARAVRLDVPLINQMSSPRLYNGCEVTSLAMVLNYYGANVTKNELAEDVPRVPLEYKDGLKGHPNDGFVGNMEDGPGLSVYHKPIFKLAKKYASDVEDLTGSKPEAIYRELSAGRPVWVITTTNLTPVSNLEEWETKRGKISVSYNVHSVAVTGFDKEHVYVNDPYGTKDRKVDRKKFEEAWEQMGSQAIVVRGLESEKKTK